MRFVCLHFVFYMWIILLLYIMEIASINEENLREAAAVGNVEKVEALIRQGVNVNSRNSVNGW